MSTSTTTTISIRSSLPPHTARIATPLEAMRRFDELLRHSDPWTSYSTDQTERRVPTWILSLDLVERVIALGGESELQIAKERAVDLTVRLSTLAMLILREVPAPTEMRAAPFEMVSFRSAAYLVPQALEVLMRRYQLFGLQPDDAGDAGDAVPAAVDSEQIRDAVLAALQEPAAKGAAVNEKAATPVVMKAKTESNAQFKVRALKRRGAFPLCDALAIEQRIEQIKKIGSREWEAIGPMISQLKQRPWRQPALCDSRITQSLDGLRRDFPNFGPLLDMYAAQLQLKRLTRSPLVLRPTLLVGPPGIGKTAFMQRFCKTLNLAPIHCAVATLSAGWILSGRHSGWRGASPGLIAQSVLSLPNRQGLMLWLDEVDKIPANENNAPVLPILLELLEPLSRQTFRDEFLEVTMNLLPLLSVLGTANKIDTIPPPLLSRFQVVEIPAPTATQMPAVIRSVDRSMRETEPGLKQVFAPLEESVCSALGQLPPRQAYQVLEGAYGLAAMRASTGARGVKLTVADVESAVKQIKRNPAQSPVATKAQLDQERDEIALLLFQILGGGGRGGGNRGGPGGHRVH